MKVAARCVRLKSGKHAVVTAGADQFSLANSARATAGVSGI